MPARLNEFPDRSTGAADGGSHRDDDSLFRGFFSRHYRSLRDLAFLLCGNWSEAEGLAQDALVRTFAAWPAIRDPGHASAYARRVLVNRHSRCCGAP